MNIPQFVPRIDCIHYAKCGKKSLSHCRKYRETDKECTGCALIKMRSSKNYKITDEVDKKRKCSRCGQFLALHWFYKRNIKRGDKTYHTHSSVCKICVSKPKQK